MNMKLEVVQCLEYQEPKVQRMENLEPYVRLLSLVLGSGGSLYIDYRRYGRHLQAEEKEVV